VDNQHQLSTTYVGFTLVHSEPKWANQPNRIDWLEEQMLYCQFSESVQVGRPGGGLVNR